MQYQGGKFFPITNRVGFLAADLKDVASAMVEWRRSLYGTGVSEEWLDGGFPDNWQFLEPLTNGHHPRHLLVATKGGQWTAIFNCGRRGSDVAGPVTHLVQKMNIQALLVEDFPEASPADARNERPKAGLWGSLQFSFLDPEGPPPLRIARAISLIQDGARWFFEANGKVQDFEQAKEYENRRTRSKFTEEMLASYCATFGVEPWQDDFYAGPCVLIDDNVAFGIEEISLARLQDEI